MMLLPIQIEEIMTKKDGLMTYGLSKHSPYKIYMNRILLKILANGQYFRLMKNWKVSKQDCTPLIRSGTPLSFEKLFSLFFIIGIGVIAAWIVMLYEKCTFSEKVKAEFIKQREDNIATFRKKLREVHFCLDNHEWPESELLQSFYKSSEKIKIA